MKHNTTNQICCLPSTLNCKTTIAPIKSNISRQTRLFRPQEKTKTHPNESSRRHIKTMKARVQQRGPAVIFYPVLKSYYLSLSNISRRTRLPRLQEVMKTHPNESSRQRSHQNYEYKGTARRPPECAN